MKSLPEPSYLTPQPLSPQGFPQPPGCPPSRTRARTREGQRHKVHPGHPYNTAHYSAATRSHSQKPNLQIVASTRAKEAQKTHHPIHTPTATPTPEEEGGEDQTVGDD